MLRAQALAVVYRAARKDRVWSLDPLIREVAVNGKEESD